MNTFRRFTLVALGALAILSGIVHDSHASAVTYPQKVVRARYPAGVETADSSVFVCEGAVASWATADTTQTFGIKHINYELSNAATTQAQPLLRVTIAGVPSGPAVDTLLAYIDFAHTRSGPWTSQSNAANNGFAAPTALILTGGATNADSTGAGLFFAGFPNNAPPTATFNTYHGFITYAPGNAASTSPILWEFGRLRLSGDKTAASNLFIFDIIVDDQVDLIPVSNPARP